MVKPLIKSLAIEKGDKAFLPEAYVYKKMFEDVGVIVDFIQPGCSTVTNYDAVVLFHGFHPFWKKYPEVVIGEYHSLSVGRLSRLKDFLKRTFNVRADYYVFLNEFVRKKLWFSRSKSQSLRGMGFCPEINEIEGGNAEFDIVYCGSYRKGLSSVVYSLADFGFSIAVVGLNYNFNRSNIKEFGKLEPNEARKIIKKSRFGLNYTPNIFPLNVQDSTKVIEYCGLGLGVITNDYFWVREFERKRGGKFLLLDYVLSKGDLNIDYRCPDVEDLRWEIITKKLLLELETSFRFPSVSSG